MHDVAAGLTAVLSAPPSGLLPAASIAPRRPSAAGEMPSVAISISVDRAEELGFGRLVRASYELPGGDSHRDDQHGDRLGGTVTFEVWAAQPARADELARGLDARLHGGRAALRERGFAALRPAGLEALESLRHEPGAGAPFTAWRQRLSYRFLFEGLEGAELITGGVIRRVDVDLVEAQESFSAPTAPT